VKTSSLQQIKYNTNTCVNGSRSSCLVFAVKRQEMATSSETIDASRMFCSIRIPKQARISAFPKSASWFRLARKVLEMYLDSIRYQRIIARCGVKMTIPSHSRRRISRVGLTNPPPESRHFVAELGLEGLR
jgi:hypothetical protein